jgi:hypothetical protein
VNFTRDAVILSVITPKEGCKLVVRNSKGVGQEDYLVDAVEIISFGSSTFFRSLERPKFFLLPVNDYEILEIKETRMVLKNATDDKSITGKKEGNIKKRFKRRRPITTVDTSTKEKGGDKNDEIDKVSSKSSKPLLPPPNTLIKEKLERLKNEEFFEKNILPGEIKDQGEEEKS